MTQISGEPFQLLPIFRERVWGRDTLSPWFSVGSRKERIGEVWFTFQENLTSLGSTLGELITRHPEVLGEARDARHPGICPLLIKLLLTSERLSVQVHPDDAYAATHHQSLGKTEAWHVLDAQPPGEIALGFREPMMRERLMAAAKSGEIERLLQWRKVRAGETIFVPAGTVHAIGAGLTIYEVQENSDVTYRMYDYHRGRELHLQDGVAVADRGPYEHNVERIALGDGREQLVACPYFRMERLTIKQRTRIRAAVPFYLLLLCVKGCGQIHGQAFEPGQAWMVPAYAAEVTINGPDSEWILSYTAHQSLEGINAS